MRVEGAGGVPGEGPHIVLRLEIQEGRVLGGTFESNGCPAAHKAAWAVIAFAKGRNISALTLLEPADMTLLAGPLPEGKGFYYDLAVQALQQCLKSL